MPPEFSRARVKTHLTLAEGVADTLTARIRDAITSIVGDRTVPLPALTVNLECLTIDVGNYPGAAIISGVLKTICLALQKQLQDLEGFIERLADFVKDAIDRAIGNLETFINRLIDDISERISEVFSGVLDGIDAFIQAVLNGITSAFDAVASILQSVQNAFLDGVTRLLSAASSVWDAIKNGINDVLSGLLTAVSDTISFLSEKLSDAFDVLVGAAETVLQGIQDGFRFAIEALVQGAEAGLRAIEQVLADIPGVLRELGTDVLKGIADSVGTPLGVLGTLLFEQIDQAIDDVLKAKDISPENALGEIMERIGVPPDMVTRVRGMLAGVTPDAQFITASVVVGVLVSVLPIIAGAVMSPLMNELRQEVEVGVRSALLPVPDALDAFYRGEMDRDTLNRELAQAGIPDDKIEMLITTGRRFANPQDLMRWWLRDIIDEGELDKGLVGQRVRPEDLKNFKTAAFFIPGPGDLIRMAVREVFTPSVREQFGLDDEFPEEFAQFGKQVGLSEEWSKRFWGAHWILPSAQMGFEMFHRAVIDEDTLNLLLRTQDVMPFWRDALTKIAFRPITRVDVRRFHKLGLIDEVELKRRYQDLGYSPDDADSMVTFTVAFNSDDEPEGTGESASLTRTLTLDLMEDGAITPDQAHESLRGLGYSEDHAALLVGQRELSGEREDRKAQADLIVDRVRAGEITFDQAQDDLGTLGLEPDELGKVLTRLTRDLTRKPKFPSVKQLGDMLADGIIDAELYQGTLELSGFSRAWSERLLTLTQRG